LDLTYIQIY